jgi:hypothetical protein
VTYSRTQLAILFTSALAAFTTWLILLFVHPIVPLPEELFGLTQPNTEQVAQLREHSRMNDSYALAIYGALGMLAGLPLLFFKRTDSLHKSSWFWRLPLFVVSSVVAGGACGLALSWIGFYCYDWLPITWDALVRVSVRLTAMLLPFALVAGLLIAICAGRIPQLPSIFLGGVIGAALAAVSYAIIAGVALQNENSDPVLPPGTICRLLLFFVIACAIWSTILYQLKTTSSVLVRSSEQVPESI